MIRVKDSNDVVIEGLYRDSNGVLIVKNDNELDKYNKQKQIILDKNSAIQKMTDEIEELKRLVHSLIENRKT